MIRRTAAVTQTLGALFCFVAGFVYLTRTEFLPYHAQGVGVPWKALTPPPIRTGRSCRRRGEWR